MYPPREDRGETPPPSVNEFAQGIWFGLAWMAFALVEWARSGSGRRASWKIMMAIVYWINAAAVKLGWTSKKRWTAIAVGGAATAGVEYLTR